MKNYAYNSMNFNSLSTEHDKHDFGLIKYECLAVGQPAQSPTLVWEMVPLFIERFLLNTCTWLDGNKT